MEKKTRNVKLFLIDLPITSLISSTKDLITITH